MIENEEKFTKLFAPFRAIRPRESMLSSVLERVTISRQPRFNTWSYQLFSFQTAFALTALLLLILGVRGYQASHFDIGTEVLAIEMESEEIGGMLLLDMNYE